MHGRLKVRTTAEQQEAKRKERQIRAKKYLVARNAIAQRREQNGVDDITIDMITKLLGGLPDFGTMWNWRRQGFERLWVDLDEASRQKGCLEMNPKSYGVWHQRRWTMLQAPNPPWKSELDNCNLFLKKDSRNFHCWDYRRFVVKSAGNSVVTASQEFDYTLEKLSENFSNYSAWHYRSTLLPRVRPGDGDSMITAEALTEELDTVSSAFYIDPKDQSAWFYHRWLLGREDTPPLLCMTVREDGPLMSISILFTQPAYVHSESVVVSIGNEQVKTYQWKGARGSSSEASTLWATRIESADLVDAGDVSVEFQDGAVQSIKKVDQPKATVVIKGNSSCQYLLDEQSLRAGLSRYRIPSKILLEEQITSCEELLTELDDGEEKKWALLAIVYMMRGLDPAKYRDAILEHLKVLTQIDPKRVGYYKDIRSRYTCEDFVSSHVENPLVGNIDMCGMALTSIHHVDHLCMTTSLDLSNNSLIKLEQAYFLGRLRILNLNNNCIKGIYGTQLAGLTSLEELQLKGNEIASLRGLSGLVSSVLPSLKQLALHGNPVCNGSSFAPFVAEEFNASVNF